MRPKVIIHHKDGDPTNSEIDNPELATQPQSERAHTATRNEWRVHRFKSAYPEGNDLLALNNVGKNPHGRNYGAYVETVDGTSIAQTDGDTYEEAVEHAIRIITEHNQQIRLMEALKSVIANHCSNDKLFCGSCSPAREVLAAIEQEGNTLSVG